MPQINQDNQQNPQSTGSKIFTLIGFITSLSLPMLWQCAMSSCEFQLLLNNRPGGDRANVTCNIHARDGYQSRNICHIYSLFPASILNSNKLSVTQLSVLQSGLIRSLLSPSMIQHIFYWDWRQKK